MASRVPVSSGVVPRCCIPDPPKKKCKYIVKYGNCRTVVKKCVKLGKYKCLRYSTKPRINSVKNGCPKGKSCIHSCH